MGVRDLLPQSLFARDQISDWLGAMHRVGKYVFHQFFHFAVGANAAVFKCGNVAPEVPYFESVVEAFPQEFFVEQAQSTCENKAHQTTKS